MSKSTSYTSNTFTSYSSFFSSGLLAQSEARNPRLKRRGTFNSDISEPWDDEFSDSSRPSSPVALADDSIMDIDMVDSFASTLLRRSTTPTPRSQAESQSQGETTPVQGAGAGASTSKSNLSASQGSNGQPTPTPRLRRRRSSLTLGTSPMNSIRSATRAAGNALHLQKQIPTAGLARSRSGSIGTNDTVSLYAGMTVGVASEGTSLIGRMRSGSCSSIVSLPSPVVGMGIGVMAPVSRYINVSYTHPRPASSLTTLSASSSSSTHRPRRPVRRIPTTPMPALRAPPPNAPLPALPSSTSNSVVASMGPVRLRPTNINLAAVTAAAVVQTPSLKSPTATSARARGLSVSNSGLDGAEHRIDEMKEN